MKHFYAKTVLGVSMFCLIGCQTISGGSLLNIGYSDNSITTAVYSALVNNDLATTRIHVTTQQRTVILSGYVKTIRQSDMALDIASKVPGVKEVQNELIVRK